MQPPLVIAIDGPSGSGKSSVARALAARFGLHYLDTGAMYRAFALWSLKGHTDMSTCPLTMSVDPGRSLVQLDGEDVTAEIRGPDVTREVSRVAADPDVRQVAVARQRQLIEQSTPGIVVEGRDITSVVAPDAKVRIFLTADLAAREARRAAEFDDSTIAREMRATVSHRDAIDTSRAHSPLREVEGVHRIDATHLTLDDVIAQCTTLVLNATGGQS